MAKTLFGPVLTLVILFYLAVLPFLYTRISWVARIADHLAIPVPGARHAAWAIIASLVIMAIQVGRKWEVYELIFGLLALSVFLLPQNRDAVT